MTFITVLSAIDNCQLNPSPWITITCSAAQSIQKVINANLNLLAESGEVDKYDNFPGLKLIIGYG